jgi:hypothetical protein
MPTRCRWVLGAIWLAFLIRGAFYCQYLPLWEGYDEWAHYAFVEHLRLQGTLPLTTDPITEEIRHSVQSAPLPHEAADPMRGYEAQQPPLYYWILSPLNRLLIQEPIATRVRLLRCFSVCIASLAIPFAYLAAWNLFYSRAMALSVCALITAMPGLMIDIARIGNECLSIAIASWIIALLLQRRAPALGLALGLGLLTKAYFLAFIPILIVRRRLYSLLVAIAIGGWWYGRNLRLTGSLTGEIMDVAAAKLGFAAKLAAIGKVHWLAVLDVALWTHIWTGAWSFFTVRSWIYRVFELIFAILVIMVILALAKRPWGRFKGKLAMLISLEALFAAGISYQALMIFIEKNISFAPGWYFYAVVVAEALLLASGALILAGRKRALLAMGFLIVLFAALDIYSTFFVLARHYKR